MKHKLIIFCLFLLTTTLLFAPFTTRSITLGWDANVELDLAGYHIYRGILDTPQGSVMELIGTVGLQTTVEYDDFLPNTRYVVGVAAFNAAGEIGPMSDLLELPITNLKSFRKIYFNTEENVGIAADDANPTGDGVSNFLKFCCWLNPTESIGSEKRVRLGALYVNETHSFFSYYQSRGAVLDGVIFTVEWSTDLINWTVGGTDTVSGFNYYNIVVNSIPRNGDRQFARLKVTLP